MAPVVLNLGSRWKLMVSFMPRQLLTPRRELPVPHDRYEVKFLAVIVNGSVEMPRIDP
jgi:hypothetical protein